MAITVSATAFERARKQFEGLFSEMFVASATLSFAAVSAGAEDTGAITVTGVDVSKGDMVVGFSFNSDPEPNIFNYQCLVSADNTVELTVTNMSAANDTPGPTKIWVVVGRPAWSESA